jgi:voltage-gated potassium channel
LIALSVGAVAGWLVLGVVLAVGLVVGVVHHLFPGGRFFTLALANFIGIYACVFIFFVESRFALVGELVLSLGFSLPLAAFLVGVVRRRSAIREVVLSAERAAEPDLGRAFLWLLPVGAVGLLVFLLPPNLPIAWIDGIFLAAMSAIGAVVLFAAEDVAVLLLDCGLLFEEFFQQIRTLVEPAFAFFTFYSLLVIVFAALYTVIDRFSAIPNFEIHGVARDITFSESLYFSVITLSTVGYGDVFPMADLVRLLVAVQVVSGVLLLLFGFNAIFSFSSTHHRRPPGT